MGSQISWLIPAALVLLAGCLWFFRGRPRTDRQRAAFLLWGGWLVVTGVVFSFAEGIIHPYYTVALAPAVAALVGMGAATLWSRRASSGPRIALAVALAASAVWSTVLLDRAPTWHPVLRPIVLFGGLGLAVILLAVPRLGGRGALAFGTAGVVVGLAGPAAYAIDTASTPHSGAIPSAGPAVIGAFGPGGGGASRGLCRRRCAAPAGFGRRFGGGPAGGFGGGPRGGGGFAGPSAGAVGTARTGGGAAASSTPPRPGPPSCGCSRPTPATTPGSPPPWTPTRPPATSWPPTTR